MQSVTIFDTTITSSALTPGVRLRVPQRIRIAQALEQLGVDVIGAGFPGNNLEEQVAAREILSHTSNVAINLTTRCSQGDITAALNCLGGGQRVHLSLAMSLDDEALEHKLQLTRAGAIEKIKQNIAFALRYFPQVHFTIREFGKVDHQYLVTVLQSLVNQGVHSITLADSRGMMMPEDVYNTILQLYHRVPALKDITLGIECQNHLGLAIANTWAAIRAGVSQIKCSVNGLGAAAGTASLAPMIAIMRESRQVSHPIKQDLIQSVSELVARLTGIAIANHHPITGAFSLQQNAAPTSSVFLGIQAHESLSLRKPPANLAHPDEMAVFLKERGLRIGHAELQSLCKKVEREQRLGQKISTEKVLRLLDNVDITGSQAI